MRARCQDDPRDALRDPAQGGRLVARDCRSGRRRLEARIEADEKRLLAFDATLDLEAVRAHLATIPAICKGGPGAGPIGELPSRGRFRWLVSPRSTIIQMSPVHTGRTSDPAACLEKLMDQMVRP